MPFHTPSLDTLIKQGEQDIESALDGSQPRLPFSVERVINFATSTMVKDLYDHQEWVARQIVPSLNSDDETIIDRAARRGVIRKSAQFAIGDVTFPAEDGSTITASTQMQRPDRVMFKAVADASAKDGAITVKVKATIAGTLGNSSQGVQLKLLTPISGVTSSGVVKVAISGGTAPESMEALLERLLFQMRYPPQGGAASDYQRWALEVPGVTRAWTYPTWWGLGTVGLTFVRDFDDTIFPNSDQLEHVAAYIDRHFDPATHVEVGNPVGAELVMMALKPKVIPLTIGKVEDGLKRAAIKQELKALERRIIVPGQTLPLTQVQGCITRAGIYDYTLSLDSDTPSVADELITFGDIVWL